MKDKKDFSNRYRRISAIWAWIMKRLGYELYYAAEINVRTNGIQWCVRAVRKGERPQTLYID